MQAGRPDPSSATESSRLHPLLARRDPRFIARLHPIIRRMVRTYYRGEVEGAENLPRDAALLVATHNGGLYIPDYYVLLCAFWERHGHAAPGYGLAHRFVFQIPHFGRMIAKVGGVYACRQNARLVLRSGYPLLIYPGGEVDALKPFSRRHRITMDGRRGFVRLALREQVPIVPVVSVGAHEVMFVLNDGRRLARYSGAEALFRIKSIPMALSFPFGLTPAGLFALPLPSKIRLRVLPPMRLDAPPEAAEDDAAVERCFRQVCRVMQRNLDELAAARRFPVIG